MASEGQTRDSDEPSENLDAERPLETKVFCDPIHGHIELHPLLIKIIDTPEFQRLRYIKQLGGCYFVFPGAVHSRFEHSIGVCHLAGELVEALRANQGKLQINDKDVLCVKIAGLCHDLGHGPFSHMFEEFMRKANKLKNWKHEDASVQMFRHLIKENNLQEELSKHDLLFIEELIRPPPNTKDDEWPYEGRTKEKEFLYQIVANGKNGIDVDKWDYFARDCHYLGVKTNFDYRRFMKFARVIKVNNGGKFEQIICTRDKEVANAYEMFHTRYTLHRIAYQHKTTKVIEQMICDAFLKADKHLHLSSCIGDMSDYTELTDHVFHKILYSDKDDLKDARELLINIQKRKIYKFIGQTRPKEKKKDKKIASDKEIDSALKPTETSVEDDDPVVNKTDKEIAIATEIVALNPKTSLEAKDLLVDIVTFNYGKHEKNPIDSLWFYSKDDPDEAKHIEKDEVSFLLPEKFQVQQIRVYCKIFDDDDDDNKITAAKECFDTWSKQNGSSDELATLQETSLGDQNKTETTPEKKTSSSDQATPEKTIKNDLGEAQRKLFPADD